MQIDDARVQELASHLRAVLDIIDEISDDERAQRRRWSYVFLSNFEGTLAPLLPKRSANILRVAVGWVADGNPAFIATQRAIGLFSDDDGKLLDCRRWCARVAEDYRLLLPLYGVGEAQAKAIWCAVRTLVDAQS